MYNPIGGSTYEFLELQNIGATPVDLSGFSFDGITYVFPNGTILAPGALMVLANNASPSAFATRYPGVVVAGYYGGNLSNSGERIALLDQNGNTVISVDYSNGGGWPTAANGGGYSLEIINPNGDPDDPANWRASLAVNGSPGYIPTVPATNSIRFNEVMAENAGAVTNGTTTNSDWVELYNSGSNSVNLANWSLSNSGNARKYVFPGATIIPPGGYLVVWCDSADQRSRSAQRFYPRPQRRKSFPLRCHHESRGCLQFRIAVDQLHRGPRGPSAAWQLTVPTPGAANIAATVGAATNLVHQRVAGQFDYRRLGLARTLQ